MSEQDPDTGNRPEDVPSATLQLAGDRQFEELRAEHQTRVYGYIRPRARSENDAREIENGTWAKVRRVLPIPEPSVAFVKYWAQIELKQFYAKKKDWRKVEIVETELRSRYPDRADDQDVVDLVADRAQRLEPSPEAQVLRAEEKLELLRRMLRENNPPHQSIVFGFVKPLGWPPRDVVEELSDTTLQDLAARLESDYTAEFHLTARGVQAAFGRFKESLKRDFEDVVKDEKTRDTYPRLAGRTVGGTTLREYYRRKPETDDIYHFWFAVRRRILAQGPLLPCK